MKHSMSPHNKRQLKASLQTQRRALQARLRPAERHSQTDMGAELRDEGDRANATMSAELTLIQRSRAETLLRAINAALDRIDSASYGICLSCEQTLSLLRLQAIPWARYCIACQELMDLAEPR